MITKSEKEDEAVNLNDNQNGNSEMEKHSEYGYGWRHIVTVLTFFGCTVLYAVRVNLGIAIVPMVNQTAVKLLYQKDNFNEGQIVWSEPLQGMVLASFFYGYIVTQIPGGILAGVFGAKWVFGFGTLCTSLLTLLAPMAARAGAGYLIALRILEGICQGVTWPAVQSLFSKWAPPSERTQLPAFACSGYYVGTILAFFVSGMLAESNFLGGWPSSFYLFGFIGCIWFVFWAIFVESSPDTHRWISWKERKYILQSIKVDGKRPSYMDIEWTKVMRSLPLWAAIWSHFTFAWCLYVTQTGLPKYFKEVLGFDIKANGAASALPYLCRVVVQVAAAKSADLLRKRYKISTTTVRKLFDCSGHFLPAIFLIAVGYSGCNATAAVVLLTIGITTSGFVSSGFTFNFLDLAPHFSGILFGISNTIGSVPGIVGPSVTSLFIEGAYGEAAIYAWRNVFCIAAGLSLSSVVFYAIFASGKVQPWATSGRRRDSTKQEVPLNG